MPDPLPVATLAEWEADARAARNDHVGCDNPRCGVHRGPERVLALLASHAALEQRVALAEGLTRADTERLRQAEERVWPGMTHGCDAPEWMADEILALRQDKERAEQRIKELEEDLANATGGFDAAMGLADAEQERAKAAEQRVAEMEAENKRLARVLRDARYNEQLQQSDPVLCCEIDNVLGGPDVP